MFTNLAPKLHETSMISFCPVALTEITNETPTDTQGLRIPQSWKLLESEMQEKFHIDSIIDNFLQKSGGTAAPPAPPAPRSLLSSGACPSLIKNMFSFVVKIPVDRGLSGTHRENRNASDFYDSYDTELGSSGTEWDAYFCMFSYIVYHISYIVFSYIVRIGDRKNPRYLRSLRHMRTRLKDPFDL